MYLDYGADRHSRHSTLRTALKDQARIKIGSSFVATLIYGMMEPKLSPGNTPTAANASDTPTVANASAQVEDSLPSSAPTLNREVVKSWRLRNIRSALLSAFYAKVLRLQTSVSEEESAKVYRSYRGGDISQSYGAVYQFPGVDLSDRGLMRLLLSLHPRDVEICEFAVGSDSNSEMLGKKIGDAIRSGILQPQ